MINAQKNLLRVLEYSALDNTPPVYNIFLWLWIKVFGISEFSIRFPSVVFTGLTASLIFLFLNKKQGVVSGIFGSLLFLSSNFVLWYAQEARCYALINVFAVLSIWCFDSWLENDSIKNRKWLITINSLLLFTHYLTAFLLVAQGIYILIFRYDRFNTFLRISKKIGLIFAIWSIAMIRNIIGISKGFWIPKTSSDTLLSALNDFFISPYLIGALLVVAILVQLNKGRDNEILRYLLLMATPIILLIGVSFLTPLFISRYLIYLVPIFSIALSLIIFKIDKQPIAIGIAILISTFSGMRVELIQPKPDDVKALVQWIKSNETSETVFVLQTDMSHAMFTYYYDKEGLFKYPYSVRDKMMERGMQLVGEVDQLNKEKIDSAQEVFLINLFEDGPDPSHQVLKYIQSKHEQVLLEKEFGSIKLKAYK